MGNEIDICTTPEFRKCNFVYICLNWIISNEAQVMKVDTLVVYGNSEAIVSQFLYLCPSFYFMKSRNLS